MARINEIIKNSHIYDGLIHIIASATIKLMWRDSGKEFSVKYLLWTNPNNVSGAKYLELQYRCNGMTREMSNTIYDWDISPARIASLIGGCIAV